MIWLNYFGYFPLVYFVLFSKVIILLYLVSSMCQSVSDGLLLDPLAVNVVTTSRLASRG
jgi:hypothetical protein